MYLCKETGEVLRNQTQPHSGRAASTGFWGSKDLLTHKCTKQHPANLHKSEKKVQQEFIWRWLWICKHKNPRDMVELIGMH